MGNAGGKQNDVGVAARNAAITGGGGAQKGKGALPKLPQGTAKSNPDDYAFLEVGHPL